MCPFFGGDWSVLRKWGCAALGRGRGGWNGSRGCIRGRRIRLRVVDVWRNLGRISSDTRWNKVSYIMCQNQVLMLSVWTLLNKPPVGLEMCVSDTVLAGSCGMGFFICCWNNTISVWDQQCSKLNKSELDFGCPCVKPFTQTDAEYVVSRKLLKRSLWAVTHTRLMTLKGLLHNDFLLSVGGDFMFLKNIVHIINSYNLLCERWFNQHLFS